MGGACVFVVPIHWRPRCNGHYWLFALNLQEREPTDPVYFSSYPEKELLLGLVPLFF